MVAQNSAENWDRTINCPNTISNSTTDNCSPKCVEDKIAAEIEKWLLVSRSTFLEKRARLTLYLAGRVGGEVRTLATHRNIRLTYYCRG